MSQIRLAYVNLKIVSRNTNVSCTPSSSNSSKQQPPELLAKVERLHRVRPKAAAVVERLVDSLLAKIG
jgi:hypothetical protein